MQLITIQFAVRVRKDYTDKYNIIQIDLPETETNGVGRITVNKQMAATICSSGQGRFAELFLIILIKWTVKLVLI